MRAAHAQLTFMSYTVVHVSHVIDFTRQFSVTVWCSARRECEKFLVLVIINNYTAKAFIKLLMYKGYLIPKPKPTGKKKNVCYSSNVLESRGRKEAKQEYPCSIEYIRRGVCLDARERAEPVFPPPQTRLV